MQKLAIVLVFASFAAFSLAAIKPESKLYFSIPLGPAPAAATTAAAAAATTAAANATADNSTTAAAGEATTAASSGLVLNIIPLGQLLGMLFTGLFGSTLPSGAAATGAQLNIVPLGQALGMIFTGLFSGLAG